MEGMVVDYPKNYGIASSGKPRGCLCWWVSLQKWIGCIPIAFQELQVWSH